MIIFILDDVILTTNLLCNGYFIILSQFILYLVDLRCSTK